MSKPLHEFAGDLIPELNAWNEGRGIDIADWLACVGKYDQAVAYLSVFWPDFVVRDDCVFLSDPTAEHYATWISTLEGDKSKVEAVINHLHIMDMFPNDSEPSENVVIHIARVLKDMWSCKLQRDFPEREFQVDVYSGTSDNLLGYEITFFQRTSG